AGTHDLRQADAGQVKVHQIKSAATPVDAAATGSPLAPLFGMAAAILFVVERWVSRVGHVRADKFNAPERKV
ncbi:MAG: hypothetical protein IAF08_11655, partial [Rhizobacter sp.]|nr:hypothetical protein [Chlorobiales bacterium]